MHRTLRRPVTGLTLALSLAAGPVAARPTPAFPMLSPAQLAVHQSQQSLRVTQAHDTLLGQRSELGLGEREDFVTSSAFTNSQGQTIVWMDQTYGGFRVWGGRAVAHVMPDGSIRTLTQALESGIHLEGVPELSAEHATQLALNHLAPLGPLADAPRVERVVFPTRLAVVDPLTQRSALDHPTYDHPEPVASHVWAYEVRIQLNNVLDGLVEQTYVIEGRTGAILDVRDALQYQAAPPTVPTPVKGTGLGAYRGPVSLDTTWMPDGTYALWDTTRGTLDNPGVKRSLQGDGTSWNPKGMQVWYGQNNTTGAYTGKDYVFRGDADNAWGNGEPFTEWGSEGGANGQSAGVDAMKAMAVTWDLYKNVFLRDGIDGKGTSVSAQVLLTRADLANVASFSTFYQSLLLGAGTYPKNPKGFLSLTDLDVIAHEMTHGVIASTSKLFANGAGYEEGSLNEGSADFFAEMAKAYATRGPSFPANLIPPTGADWKHRSAVNRGTPLRWLDKPSKDGRSAEAWYDGVALLETHFSSGVLNRALYFLAQGASATPGDDSHSVYLPGGMTGIGNDAAARIWFKTVTERLVANGTASLTFKDARAQALVAAAELYGAGSPQVIAVENAFAAVNVGDGHGQAPRTQVLFANWRNGDYTETKISPGWANKQRFPKGETGMPRITVLNNEDTRVTWSIGGPSMYNGSRSEVKEGGRINADGSWSTPNRMGWHALTVTSVADPTQFAEGRAFLINMDNDADTEQDALDMGAIATSWFLSKGLSFHASTVQAPFVNDDDIANFVDAMRSAWPVK